MLKNFTLIFSLLTFFACSNKNKLKSEKQGNISDTIVIKKKQSKEEVDYFVSVKNKKSNVKYVFVKRTDQTVVISRNFNFPNLPPQESVFSFDELKYVLKEAKSNFKIDLLKYIIYGNLDTAKDINSVINIAKKYIEDNNRITNISTKDYGKISELILYSNIVKDINKSLFPYSKVVSKINIEQAVISKSNRTSSEIMNGFVVMEIGNKE